MNQLQLLPPTNCIKTIELVFVHIAPTLNCLFPKLLMSCNMQA